MLSSEVQPFNQLPVQQNSDRLPHHACQLDGFCRKYMYVWLARIRRPSRDLDERFAAMGLLA